MLANRASAFSPLFIRGRNCSIGKISATTRLADIFPLAFLEATMSTMNCTPSVGTVATLTSGKVATVPTDGVQFIVDIVASKNANGKISASLVVAEIFPMEQFRPRMNKGENADALLASIQYYTLLRLHEVVRARSYEALCMSIAADLGDKVLSKEYAERSD